MDLWRISRHRTLNGEGSRLVSGRWHTAGTPVVYLADSIGSAMLEILVHLQLEDGQAPPSYTLLRVVAPDDLGAPVLYDPVYDNWKTDLDLTRQLGDAWLKAQSSAITRVPSAILPLTYNYLLNPLHTDAPRVEIVSSHQGVFDERLIWR